MLSNLLLLCQLILLHLQFTASPKHAKQDHLRMNVALDRTIILGLQIFLDQRSLSSIDQEILMTPPPKLDRQDNQNTGQTGQR